MIIGGLQKFSLLDYPGRVSAIVFTQGCNFRCRFCYNPMLVWPNEPASSAGRVSKSKYASEKISGQQKVHPETNLDDLFVFLKSRAGKLDAVVITGGEPCLHKDLPEFIKKIRKLGFLIKLDTNGSFSEMLEKLIKNKLIDYIAMDLKAPEEKYEEVIGLEIDFKKIAKSVKLIMKSGLPYEFRTTVVPGLIDKNDIEKMGKIIKGANAWYLQNFKSNTALMESELEGRVPYNSRQMKEMAAIGSQFVKKCEIR